MELFLKIGLAVVMVMLIWRLYPAAKHQMKNGPKGTSSDWNAALLPIAAVVLFVAFLIWMVRN